MWPCRVQPRRSSSPPTASWLVSSWYDEFRSYRVRMREQDRVDFAEAAFGPVLERARVERLPALRSSARTDRGGRTSMSSVLVLPGEPSTSTLGIRSTAEVLRRTLRCPAAVPSRVERQHAHPGRGPVGDAVRHPTDGTQLEVPVPRSSSSSDIDEGTSRCTESQSDFAQLDRRRVRMGSCRLGFYYVGCLYTDAKSVAVLLGDHLGKVAAALGEQMRLPCRHKHLRTSARSYVAGGRTFTREEYQIEV